MPLPFTHEHVVEWIPQISAFFIILALGLGGGLLPIKISKSNNASRRLSFLNAFTGGLFLAAGLESFVDAVEEFEHIHFLGSIGLGHAPWAMIFALLAVIIIAVAETCFVDVHDDTLLIQHDDGKSELKKSDHTHDHGTSPFILVVLLAVHSVLEGTAVGSAHGTSFYVIATAICAHKFFAGLALGTAISNANYTVCKHFSLVLVFALATPIGQIIGLSLASFLEADAAEITAAIFAGLAAGTFSWVSLCEILHPELIKGTIKEKRIKVLLAALGMLSIVVVTFIMHESGGHHH
ncbi:hypothetical protein P9112_008177 [Eukaryota sp. TZLM1-RC]